LRTNILYLNECGPKYFGLKTYMEKITP